MAYKFFAMVLTKLRFPFFEIFIFRLFTGPKKAKKGHFCLFFTLTGPKKGQKSKNQKKQQATFLDTLHRACIPIFRSNKQFSREEYRFLSKKMFLWTTRFCKNAKFWLKLSISRDTEVREISVNFSFFSKSSNNHLVLSIYAF